MAAAAKGKSAAKMNTSREPGDTLLPTLSQEAQMKKSNAGKKMNKKDEDINLDLDVYDSDFGLYDSAPGDDGGKASGGRSAPKNKKPAKKKNQSSTSSHKSFNGRQQAMKMVKGRSQESSRKKQLRTEPLVFLSEQLYCEEVSDEEEEGVGIEFQTSEAMSRMVDRFVGGKDKGRKAIDILQQSDRGEKCADWFMNLFTNKENRTIANPTLLEWCQWDVFNVNNDPHQNRPLNIVLSCKYCDAGTAHDKRLRNLQKRNAASSFGNGTFVALQEARDFQRKSACLSKMLEHEGPVHQKAKANIQNKNKIPTFKRPVVEDKKRAKARIMARHALINLKQAGSHPSWKMHVEATFDEAVGKDLYGTSVGWSEYSALKSTACAVCRDEVDAAIAGTAAPYLLQADGKNGKLSAFLFLDVRGKSQWVHIGSATLAKTKSAYDTYEAIYKILYDCGISCEEIGCLIMDGAAELGLAHADKKITINTKALRKLGFSVGANDDPNSKSYVLPVIRAIEDKENDPEDKAVVPPISEKDSEHLKSLLEFFQKHNPHVIGIYCNCHKLDRILEPVLRKSELVQAVQKEMMSLNGLCKGGKGSKTLSAAGKLVVAMSTFVDGPMATVSQFEVIFMRWLYLLTPIKSVRTHLASILLAATRIANPAYTGNATTSQQWEEKLNFFGQVHIMAFISSLADFLGQYRKITAVAESEELSLQESESKAKQLADKIPSFLRDMTAHWADLEAKFIPENKRKLKPKARKMVKEHKHVVDLEIEANPNQTAGVLHVRDNEGERDDAKRVHVKWSHKEFLSAHEDLTELISSMRTGINKRYGGSSFFQVMANVQAQLHKLAAADDDETKTALDHLAVHVLGAARDAGNKMSKKYKSCREDLEDDYKLLLQQLDDAGSKPANRSSLAELVKFAEYKRIENTFVNFFYIATRAVASSATAERYQKYLGQVRNRYTEKEIEAHFVASYIGKGDRETLQRLTVKVAEAYVAERPRRLVRTRQRPSGLTYVARMGKDEKFRKTYGIAAKEVIKMSSSLQLEELPNDNAPVPLGEYGSKDKQSDPGVEDSDVQVISSKKEEDNRDQKVPGQRETGASADVDMQDVEDEDEIMEDAHSQPVQHEAEEGSSSSSSVDEKFVDAMETLMEKYSEEKQQHDTHTTETTLAWEGDLYTSQMREILDRVGMYDHCGPDRIKFVVRKRKNKNKAHSRFYI
ncbi:unnamed protein product [Amoebophrya sp. A120]|nr:unnamed protein product [Amoebophrya sp. A120]|eukprot:GSA120T00022769001.1